ncbi:CaiB/BaiF CoA transferase family protein [Pararobbsia alpina]|uniref:Acetyl-CoA:oxalate CoA-transferase n=1 Tax=Pararobbsia alpina TaxID=621374 RepID=A0A6S7CCE9_9BURK|nr:CaiB/BaiF CoA-transferase family protein [Pararobbsia alpina]CAB3786097.1 Acetyl-CoA:oxalate CoA-transferase [Pararobbsia alpina]
MTGPLTGITIVSLEQAIAAPFATRQLADLGARVIKIERPEVGDFARAYDDRVKGMSSHFAWTNRSKESLTLNTKHEFAQEVLHALLEKADVLVQNLAPGATARINLDYESLKERYPRLIVCDISGYGSNGPYTEKKAYDLLVQAEAGFLSVTGLKDDMVKAGCSIADIAAGMYAYSGILAAIIERGRTGRGTRLDVSMLEAMTEWMSFPMYYAFNGASPPPRAGASHATIYPYGPFKANDGKTVILGLQNEREWVKFCQIVLDAPALATDERFASNASRSRNREELRSIIETVFGSMNSDELVTRLDVADIANGRVNDMHSVWEHPQLKARKRWRTVGSPVGKIPALLPPGGDPFEIRMDPIPAVGQHTDSILVELGFDTSRVESLRATGGI